MYRAFPGDQVAEAAARRVLEGDAGRAGGEDPVDVGAVVELVVEAVSLLDMMYASAARSAKPWRCSTAWCGATCTRTHASMVLGLAAHGGAEDALALFAAGVRPNAVALLGRRASRAGDATTTATPGTTCSCNMYASRGRHGRAVRVRKKMRRSNLTKEPGAASSRSSTASCTSSGQLHHVMHAR
jgi:hypothetical protein